MKLQQSEEKSLRSRDEESENVKKVNVSKRYSRRRKAKKKTRFTTQCPYCSSSHTLSIPAQQFQLKQTQCNEEECNEEFWVQIKDNVPTVTKQYPYHKKRKKSQSDFVDSDVEIIASPRKKRKLSSPTPTASPPQTSSSSTTTTSTMKKESTYFNFPIPVHLQHNEEDQEISSAQCDESTLCFNNLHCRPYQNSMSHIEMMSDCSRSKCSDFIPGNFHCFEAVPVELAGNVRMSEIGYDFECIFCDRRISYIERGELREEEMERENESIEKQCRFIFNQLQNKSQFVSDVPSYSRVPNSFNDLKVRDRIMASDGTHFLPAWIIKIERNKKLNMNKVLVHFKGWNSRWDKWYNINSGMLKTVSAFRKEKKMHSATRNEIIYQVMMEKYPSSRCEEERERERNEDVEVVDAELVMMHDKNETFMSLHELPIFNQNELMLCPPLIYSLSTMNGITEHNVPQIVRKCFAHLSQSLIKEKDIQLIYEKCQSKIHRLLFTLYALKNPQRVQSYLNLLQS